jgi:hypothetical protein
MLEQLWRAWSSSAGKLSSLVLLHALPCASEGSAYIMKAPGAAKHSMHLLPHSLQHSMLMPAETAGTEWQGILNVFPNRVIAGSSELLTFTMEFFPKLPASAGPVKLYSCDAQGVIGQFLTELFDNGAAVNGDATAGDSIYTAKLPFQASSGSARSYFTVAVGAEGQAPGTDVSNSSDTIVAVTAFEGALHTPSNICAVCSHQQVADLQFIQMQP